MLKKENIVAELQEVAPRLPLHTNNPYQAPSGYFDQLPTSILEKVKEKRPPNTISIFNTATTRRWLTAAACISGIVVVSLLYVNTTTAVDPKTDSGKWAKNELQKISEQGIQEFVNNHEAIYAATSKNAALDNKELKQLLKDIPTDELNAYLSEIPSNTP